jgi:hypothetical protein
MRKYTTLLFVLSLLSGCTLSKWIVECDSGFSTEPSISVAIESGIIMWRLKNGDHFMYRKMELGEICTSRTIES